MSVSSLRSFEYLEQLPGTTFRRLYQQPSTALAIFRRMLPHLAKSLVMAMLYLPQPLPTSDLDSWVRASSKREKDVAISLLNRLHILSTTSEPGRSPALRLTNPFAASLRLALTGGGDHQSFGVPCDTPDKHRVDIPYLDAFARSQWESILHYMVGSIGMTDAVSGGVKTPSQGVTKLLELGGLVENRGTVHRPSVSITQAGFSFLLQEVNAQVWTLMIFYLENAESLNMDPVDVLSFLFMLGSLTLGQDYSLTTLTPTQRQMLDDLLDFGVVYRRKPSSRRFYPTRLATTLTSDSSALRSIPSSFSSAITSLGSSSSLTSSQQSRGFLIIETNYRLYAYTSSPLTIAVLSLFTRLHTRYPNMVSGRITRDSIRRAIGTGITADQIIDYLQTHAHPQMHRSLPVLPPTVVDQIRLWQIEGERMKATSGFLFKDFNGSEGGREWEEACRHAEEIGVLVWRSEAKRAFFVTRVEGVAAFLRGRNAGGKKGGGGG